MFNVNFNAVVRLKDFIEFPEKVNYAVSFKKGKLNRGVM